MGDSLMSAVGPGVALAGVLLVMGVAAGAVGRRLPHLGVGALAGSAAIVATRAASLGAAGAVVVAVAAGAVIGAAAYLVDRRSAAGEFPLAMLPDLGVLGLAVAVSVMGRPAVFVELPLGPLGGVPTTAQGLGAGFVGLFAAAVLTVWASGRAPLWSTWVVATAAGAVAVLLGSGALSLLAGGATPVFTLADTVGLGIRAAAVGFAARRGLAWALVAAVFVGVGEAIGRTLGVSALPLLPTVVLLAAGAVTAARAPRPVPQPT